jgi:hypothetical protein
MSDLVVPHSRMRRVYWAAACENVLLPSGTFSRTYAGDRRAAVESIVDTDPVTACVREIVAERSTPGGQCRRSLAC